MYIVYGFYFGAWYTFDTVNPHGHVDTSYWLIPGTYEGD